MFSVLSYPKREASDFSSELRLFIKPAAEKPKETSVPACLLILKNEENHTTASFLRPQSTYVVAVLDLLSGDKKVFARRKTCLTILLRQHNGG